jgi:hypothetical protein
MSYLAREVAPRSAPSWLVAGNQGTDSITEPCRATAVKSEAGETWHKGFIQRPSWLLYTEAVMGPDQQEIPGLTWGHTVGQRGGTRECSGDL